MSENAEFFSSADAALPPRFEAESWLSAIVESAEDVIVSQTLDGRIVSWNPAAEALFGYRADEAVGRHISIIANPDDPGEMGRILAAVSRGERISRYETLRRRKDGTLVPVSLRISPIRDSDDRIVGASKIARDITERKRAEERVELLRADLAHRLKNLLSLVLAIVRQTRQDTVPAYKKAIEGRIFALAHVSDALGNESDDGTPLEPLIRPMLEMFVERSDNRLVTSGPPAMLGAAAAQTVAMTIHELATNAVKYGAFSAGHGTVEVSWSRDADGLALVWRETGGPRVTPPKRHGLEMKVLVSGIERELGGRIDLEWKPDGLVCSISLPPEHIGG